jgi:hypothetical protein
VRIDHGLRGEVRLAGSRWRSGTAAAMTTSSVSACFTLSRMRSMIAAYVSAQCERDLVRRERRKDLLRPLQIPELLDREPALARLPRLLPFGAVDGALPALLVRI